MKDCLLVLLNCTIWRDPSALWPAAVAGYLQCTIPESMHWSVRVTVVMGISSASVLLFRNEYRLEKRKLHYYYIQCMETSTFGLISILISIVSV